MIRLTYIFIGLCFYSKQGFAVKGTNDHPSSTDGLREFLRMLTNVEKPEEIGTNQKNDGQSDISSKNAVTHKSEPNFGNERKYLEEKDRAHNDRDLLNRPKHFGETNNPEEEKKDRKISPLALYLLKRLLFGTKNQRAERADNIIGINNRDTSLPWEEECSGGYDHCGGYFPLCCKGFVCLKPLTPWDKQHGFNRCWPYFFQDENYTDKP